MLALSTSGCYGAIEQVSNNLYHGRLECELGPAQPKLVSITLFNSKLI